MIDKLAVSRQLIAQKMECPNYDEILDSFYTNPPDSLKELLKQNEALFAYLSKHTGEVSTS